MDETKVIETEEQKGKRTSRSEKVHLDYPLIKVQLPKEAALKVHDAMVKLKDRKAELRIDELLADFLNEISEKYLEDQVDRHTPDDYYLEAAHQIPELRDLIIEKAKAALNRGTTPKKRRGRPKSAVQVTSLVEDGSDAAHNT